uniref:Zinc finger and BTB domain-containing protein 26-like n=1 Tax=Salarias fasciatus TaxID=181472 RepID=A0A672J9K6_SALFA
MSCSSDMLQFIFPTHGSAALSKMNLLREEHLFCDITLILGGPQGSSVQPVSFHGHKVVLAASSDFLRDQFRFHEGRTELSVAVVSDVNVAQMLLLTCYTGFLQVPFKELVSYLTAASALQMNQVVERCAQAVSQYLSPILAFLKLEGASGQTEIQQLDGSWPGTSLEAEEEKDAARPNMNIQDTDTQGGGADGTQDTRVIKVEVASSEETACCLNTLESEEGESIHPLQTNNTMFPVHPTAGTLKCKIHPPAIFHGLVSPGVGTSSARSVDQVESPQNRQEAEAEEENMHVSVVQVQQGAKENISDLLCHSAAALSNSAVAAADSAEAFVQRPYLCRRCDRVFQHFRSYVSHLKEHRQFSCLLCGKDFSQKSHLTHHISAHGGARPFRCPLCHKLFIQRSTLQDHLSLHTGGRPQRLPAHEAEKCVCVCLFRSYSHINVVVVFM